MFYVPNGKGKRLKVVGANLPTAGSKADSFVVEAIMAGDKEFELRCANESLRFPDGSEAPFSQLKKGDDFVKTAQAMGVVAIGGAMCAYICRSFS